MDTDQDSFNRLPSEIAIDIFSRLPVKSAARCKCVSRLWRNLLRTPEFFKTHLQRSVQPQELAVFQIHASLKAYKMVEFAAKSDGDQARWNVAASFKLPFNGPVLSSANGLLFLFDDLKSLRTEFVISNPITDQCVMVTNPRLLSSTYTESDVLGFGVSNGSGEYKIVRIFLHQEVPVTPEFRYDNWQCQVYTLGSGEWRKDQLCISDNSSKRELRMDVWVMKSYGDEKSWTKTFSIAHIPAPDYRLKSLSPLKVFEDGDMMLNSNNKKTLYYSSKTKTVNEVHLIPGVEDASIFGITSYTPSFVHLDKFTKEVVISFTKSRF